jgi:ABC-2 type transport system permease protein
LLLPNPTRCASLIRKELRQLLASRALLAALLIASALVGFGFSQAVSLFSEASRTALEHSELAPGMNPLEGVLVPTFGSLYLVTTLLFPFVAIRPLGVELQTGSLKLLAQLPVSLGAVIGVKAFATMVAWGLVGALPLAAMSLWAGQGGHLYLPELATLVLGHSLYALVILGVSFLVSSTARSTSTAAILVLALTLGSWVLDFSATTHSEGLVRALSSLSLTAGLRDFERGLLSLSGVLKYLLLGGVPLALSVAMCGGERNAKGKAVLGGLALVGLGLGLWGASYVRPSWDSSESRRNSLPAEDERVFAGLEKPLSIRVFLTPDDPRFRDLNRAVYSKLRRVVPTLSIRLEDTGKTPIYGTGGNDNYGLNEYEYDGRVETSRSSSPTEILPLLHRLIGRGTAAGDPFRYPGYPLVMGTATGETLFYLLLPVLMLIGWWRAYRISKNVNLFLEAP